MTEPTDRIERSVHIKAPIERVWRAVSNAEEFGGWFRVDLRGKAFVAGQRTKGQITYPGYEHLVFDVLVERIEPPRTISWRCAPGTASTTRTRRPCSSNSRSRKPRAARCSRSSNPASTASRPSSG